jgi:RNA polymerase sigma factor (sigma-70 family)
MSVTPSVAQPSVACSEHELVAAVRRGSDRAFEELYSRYRGRISSYILGMVGDHGRAEDVAQEVFISALRRLRDSERPIAFKPWIYEIAKNACIDEYRRTRKAREVPLEREDGAGERELQSWGPTPDAAVENKESLADLRGAFHGLSENHHKIIVMRELEGLSYSQIGERLGMSRPMVESTLFRARRRLTEEYDELVSGRRCDRIQALIADDQARSLLKLGVRERRQLARHLAHCQPCRREARMRGVDESFFKAPQRLAGKIAALLPIPWWRWRRAQASGGEDSVAASGSHSYNALQGLQSVARLLDPANPAIGFGRAAAAAAAIAVAGIGGGVVSGAIDGSGQPAAHNAARAGAIHPAAAGVPRRTAAGGLTSSQLRSGRSASVRSSRAASGAGGPAAGAAKPAGTAGAVAGPGAGSPGTGHRDGAVGAGGGGTGTVGTVNSHGHVALPSNPTLPGVPTIKLPTPKLPNLKAPLPPQLPTLPQLPSVPTSHPSGPSGLGGVVPHPDKLLGGLTGPRG